MEKRTTGLLLLYLGIALLFSVMPAQAAGTTEVHMIKYASDNSTILNETTVNYTWMEENLPVYGDGATHYYFQGPVFEEEWNRVHSNEAYNMWNPDEDVNVETRDYGAVRGTDVKDLCDLVGGMSPGDEVKIKAYDGYKKWFNYTNVYEPQPRQGPLILCWYNGKESITGAHQGMGYPDTGYYVGMRLIFFADNSTNPYDHHVFGDWDMHECLAPEYWHNYTQGDKYYPSSSGLSVTGVDTIAIYSTMELPKPTSTPVPSLSPSPTANLLNSTSAPPYSDEGTEFPYWIVVLIVIVLILIGGFVEVRNEWMRK